MIILVLAGWIAYRPVTPLNLLGAAALILWAWDPWQLLDVGFQLSFMVLLALLLVTGAVARWIYRPLRPDVFIPRGRLPSWRRYVDECTAKSCMIFSASGVAWLASLPLILYHFGLVSPITTISNCLVVPLAGTVVVLALMSVLCSVFFDPLAIVFNIINAKILMVMTAVISMLAAVPYGHFYVSQDNGLDGDTFKLTVLSCERSAPAILETQDVAMLFGAGSLREWEYRVNPARKFLGIESLNQVVVMQSNSRYLGGLSELLSTVPVEEIIMPPYPTSSSTYRKWVAALDENPGIAARVVQPVAGQSLIMDEQISGRVLWPPGKVKAWRGTAENSGLSIYLDLPGGGVLLSGNPGQKVEDQMVLPSDLPAVKVMIQGSHSREPNLAPGWLKKIQPEVIVRPASGFYPEADISWEKRNQLKRMSTELIEMGRTGPIQIRGSKDGLRILFWDKYQKEFKE
jgi:beta-lactamase superfamily II metal-dependent hydrolase